MTTCHRNDLRRIARDGQRNRKADTIDSSCLQDLPQEYVFALIQLRESLDHERIECVAAGPLEGHQPNCNVGCTATNNSSGV